MQHSGIQNHLRATKQRNGFAGFHVRDFRIPDLCGAAAVKHLGNAAHGAVAGGAQVVRFELDGGKAAGAFRQAVGAALVESVKG